jgi:hypothetical protein
MIDAVNNTERPVSIRPGINKPVGAMPVLPPKADLCGALAHVRFGSKADIRHDIASGGGGRYGAISPDSRFLLAYKSGIEGRIASRGNCTPGGCQASENTALTHHVARAKLH